MLQSEYMQMFVQVVLLLLLLIKQIEYSLSIVLLIVALCY